MIKTTILIDDDRDDLIFLRDTIKKQHQGVECITYDDPCEAVEQLEQLSHINADIVVIDFSMPKMNGLECLERLVRLRTAKSVQFVVYSGSELPAHVRDRIASLGARMIQKPDTYLEFESLVEALMKLG